MFSKDEYSCSRFFDLLHLDGAEAIAEYGNDFYKGMPALTRNAYGKGETWYIATSLKHDLQSEKD